MHYEWVGVREGGDGRKRKSVREEGKGRKREGVCVIERREGRKIGQGRRKIGGKGVRWGREGVRDEGRGVMIRG